MSYDGRRSVLKKLFSLPWIASLGGPVVSADVGRRLDPSGVLEEAEHKKLGTQLMRFLNTAELWNRQMTGKYEELSLLKQSKAVSKMRTAEETKMAGLGDAFTRSLAWNEDEIAPGWRLRVILAPDKSAYLAVLVDTTDLKTGALVSDELGLIYEAPAGVEPLGLLNFGRAKQFPRVLPITAKRPRPNVKMTLAKYAAALTGATPDWCWTCWDCCSCDTTCCHSCQCICQPQPCSGGGVNCGCGGCAWCCPIFG